MTTLSAPKPKAINTETLTLNPEAPQGTRTTMAAGWGRRRKASLAPHRPGQLLLLGLGFVSRVFSRVLKFLALLGVSGC